MEVWTSTTLLLLLVFLSTIRTKIEVEETEDWPFFVASALSCWSSSEVHLGVGDVGSNSRETGSKRPLSNQVLPPSRECWNVSLLLLLLLIVSSAKAPLQTRRRIVKRREAKRVFIFDDEIFCFKDCETHLKLFEKRSFFRNDM